MRFLAVEFPTTGIAFAEPRQPFEFLGVQFGIALARQLLQIIPNELIHTGSEDLGTAARLGYHFIVDGECHVHTHIIRARGKIVNHSWCYNHTQMGPLAIAVLLWFQASTADLIQRAAAHIQHQRLDAAIADLTRAAALDPRSSMIHLLLGQAYLAKGAAEFVAQAKAEFQQARGLDESAVLASFYIAKIDLDLGRIRQAEQELHGALEKKPGEHYLMALLGEVRRQQGDTGAAIELTTKALAAGPEAQPVYYYRALAWRDRKDGKRALEDLDRLLGTPFATADALLLAGAIRFDQHQYNEAEAHFRQAIQLQPDRAEPHLRLAQVLRRQKRFEMAVKELERVDAAPQLSSPYFQKLLADAAWEQGLIRADQGDAAGAKVWFRRALEIDPSHQEAANRLKP